MASRIGAIIAVLCCACLARHASAQIRVMAPESLVNRFAENKGRIDGSTATFSAPFYGERLLGRLVWGEPKNASAPHCTPDDFVVPPPDEVATADGKTQRLIHIVLLRRGGCSFLRKVSIAQKTKGAHAVIIVDAKGSALTGPQIRRIIVTQDGSGLKVDIPSILVSDQDGEPLIEAARDPRSQVIIELAWDIPTNQFVTMDAWMSAGSQESMRFMRDWAGPRKELNHAVRFRPHYHVFSMQPTTGYNELCTNQSAVFCAQAPNSPGRLVTGRDVLEEDLRQLCIHELYKIRKGGEAGSGTPVLPEYNPQYWDYVQKFIDACPVGATEAEKRFGKACSTNLMRQVGVDPAKVQTCVDTTQEQKLTQNRHDAAWSPSALRINGWRFQGALDPNSVTRAICAGFINQPPACASLVEPHGIWKPGRSTWGSTDEGVDPMTFVMAVLAVAGCTLGVLLLYKKSLTRHIHSALREEVMLEVQAQMDSYKQLPSA